MRVYAALFRFLSMLAIVSLVVGPLAMPASAQAGFTALSSLDVAMPDCVQKSGDCCKDINTCAISGGCVVKCVPNLVALLVPVCLKTVASILSQDDQMFEGAAPPIPARPPRA